MLTDGKYTDVRCLAWESSEPSKTLMPYEVEQLCETTQQLASLGMLTDGKYTGATKVLYWQRIQKGELTWN